MPKMLNAKVRQLQMQMMNAKTVDQHVVPDLCKFDISQS